MKINHIALYTPDLERMRVFYETYFNARSNELYHNPNTGLKTCFLSFPESSVRLEIMSRPDLETRTNRTLSEGYVHLAFSVGSRQAVDKLTETLVSNGYQCIGQPRVTGDGYYESVIADPDGNPIEITE